MSDDDKLILPDSQNPAPKVTCAAPTFAFREAFTWTLDNNLAIVERETVTPLGPLPPGFPRYIGVGVIAVKGFDPNTGKEGVRNLQARFPIDGAESLFDAIARFQAAYEVHMPGLMDQVKKQLINNMLSEGVLDAAGLLGGGGASGSGGGGGGNGHRQQHGKPFRR